MKTTISIVAFLFAAFSAFAQAGWCIPNQSSDSSTLFINGWRATVHKNYVLVTRGKVRRYFYYKDTTAPQYHFYNRFIVSPQRLVGNWTTDTTGRPFTQPVSYSFTSDSTYATQPVTDSGRYELAIKTIVLTSGQHPATTRYDCWFEATRQGFVLHLDNKNGTHYRLHKTTSSP